MRAEQLLKDLSGGVAFERKGWPVIEVGGKDRIDFLHRLSAQNFKSAVVGDSFPGAFLNGNGTVVALFYAVIRQNVVQLLVEPQAKEAVLTQIAKFHIREDLTYKDAASNGFWWELIGEQSESAKAAFQKWPRVTVLPNRMWPETAHFVGFEDSIRSAMFATALQDAGFRILNAAEYAALRLLKLIPKDGQDVGAQTLLLEAGLFEFFHPNKGCYPGQEVVERLLTKGAVPKKLVLMRSATKVQMGDLMPEIFSGSKKVGSLTTLLGFEDGDYALGFVLRTVAEREKELFLDESGLTRVEVMGFVGDPPRT